MRSRASIALLTRHDSRRRRITNIDRIESVIQQLDGCIIDPSEMKQIDKLSLARFDIIIAESSGIMNYSLFGRDNANLIALVEPQTLENDEFMLGGHPYHLLRSENTSYVLGRDYKQIDGSPVGAAEYSEEEIIKKIVMAESSWHR